MNKKMFLMISVLIISILTPTIMSRNPSPINLSTYFNPTTSIQNSSWNISENGSLQHQWSVFPATDYLMWNRSNSTNQIWFGDTIVFNDSNSDGGISFLMANNSENNRSQSIIWCYVNGSGNVNSEDVYVGVVFMNTSSTHDNATLILMGNNSTFILNYAFRSGKMGLFNTEWFEYDPLGHGGEVLIPGDAINYWSEDWGELNLTTDGIYLKSNIITYCGKIMTKFWNSNYSLNREPNGWIVNDNFENFTTNVSTNFGLCVWNPLGSNVNVSFSFIQNFRLNYSLNYSDSWLDRPRPSISFPILNTSDIGNELFSLLLSEDDGGLTNCNITNQTILRMVRNVTNNCSMTSKLFTNRTTSEFLMEDNMYIYTALLTNFSDYYSTSDYFDWMDNRIYSNNYLLIFLQNCKQSRTGWGDLYYDYSMIYINPYGNRVQNKNCKLYFTNSWDEELSWHYNESRGTMSPDVEIYYSLEEDFIIYNTTRAWSKFFITPQNSPKNIHKYNSTVNVIHLIPLHDITRDGVQLKNSQKIDLGIYYYTDEDYSIFSWSDYDEFNCSLRYSENATLSSHTFWNETYDFFERILGKDPDLFDCFITAYEYADQHWDFYENFSLWIEYVLNAEEQCIINSNSTQVHWNQSNMDLLGEAILGDTPPVNRSQGNYDFDVEISSNISYTNLSESNTNVSINISISIENTGTEDLTGIRITNMTFYNCSCSLVKMWLINATNQSIQENITYYNDTCNMSIDNLSNISPGEILNIWIIINVTSCVNDTSTTFPISINVTTSSGAGGFDESETIIRFGISCGNVRYIGDRDLVNPLDITNSVIGLMMICLFLGILLFMVAMIQKYGWLR